jgi:hypothetical protein
MSSFVQDWDAMRISLQSPSTAPPLSQGTQSDRGDPGGELKPAPPPVSDALVSVCLVVRGVGDDVCGGRVGLKNIKFCTAPCVAGETSCRFAAHAQKALGVTPGYYILATRVSEAYLQPSLQAPTDGFPAFITDALKGKRTIQEWSDAFAQLKNVDNWDEQDQRDMMARLERKIEFGPTPMKLRKRSASQDLETCMDAVAAADSWSVTTEDGLNDAMLSEDPDFKAEAHLSKHWNTVVRATQRQKQGVVELESTMKGLLEEVDDKVLKVASCLGTACDNAPALTVWASIGAHEDVLGSYAGNLAAWASVRTGLETKIASVQGLAVKAETLVHQQVLPVVKELYQHMKQGSQEPNAADAEWKKEMEQQLQTLMKHYATLKDKFDSVGSGMHSAEEVHQLKVVVGELYDAVTQLRLDNASLRAQLNTDDLSFGGHQFPTTESIEDFVAKHIPSGFYGFCYDFISILECYGDRNRDTDVGLTQRHIIGKAGYKHPASARIDVSFGCIIPKVFGLEEDPKDPSKKLGTLTSMAVWDLPSTQSGVKANIAKFLVTYRKSVDVQIIRMFGAATPITLFFQSILQKTIVFWEAFSVWIHTFEQELAGQAGVEDAAVHKESIWNLVCWMIHSMLVELSVRRSPGSGAESLFDESEGIVKCAAILHGTLAAHKFMAELIAAEFVRHPIFAATMDEFLLRTKASQVALTVLQTKMKRVEDAVKGAQAAADKAAKAAANQRGAPPRVS